MNIKKTSMRDGNAIKAIGIMDSTQAFCGGLVFLALNATQSCCMLQMGAGKWESHIVKCIFLYIHILLLHSI